MRISLGHEDIKILLLSFHKHIQEFKSQYNVIWENITNIRILMFIVKFFIGFKMKWVVNQCIAHHLLMNYYPCYLNFIC